MAMVSSTARDENNVKLVDTGGSAKGARNTNVTSMALPIIIAHKVDDVPLFL
ncbi:MAG: hypothetical protein ACRESK_08075 [Gammaproteobacteria bacterium]